MIRKILVRLAGYDSASIADESREHVHRSATLGAVVAVASLYTGLACAVFGRRRRLGMAGGRRGRDVRRDCRHGLQRRGRLFPRHNPHRPDPGANLVRVALRGRLDDRGHRYDRTRSARL